MKRLLTLDEFCAFSASRTRAASAELRVGVPVRIHNNDHLGLGVVVRVDTGFASVEFASGGLHWFPAWAALPVECP